MLQLILLRTFHAVNKVLTHTVSKN